jgi:hypothetical protein
VHIANKKVISPLDDGAPKKDLDTLVALEEAKTNAGQATPPPAPAMPPDTTVTPTPPPADDDNDDKPSDGPKIDPKSISL